MVRKFRIYVNDWNGQLAISVGAAAGWVLETPDGRALWCGSFADAVRTMDVMIRRSKGRPDVDRHRLRLAQDPRRPHG